MLAGDGVCATAHGEQSGRRRKLRLTEMLLWRRQSMKENKRRRRTAVSTRNSGGGEVHRAKPRKATVDPVGDGVARECPLGVRVHGDV